MKIKLSNLKINLLAIIAFSLLIGIFYGNTLRNGFVHDDEPQIVNNPYIQSWKYLPKVIDGCIWEFEGKGCHGSSYYRPMQNLSYLITYKISSSAAFFHFVNLLYFLLAAFLVFIFARELFGSITAGYLSSIIFIVHPINNEAVNWLATVPELLYTSFALLTLIFYIRFRRNDIKKNLYFSVAFYFLAALSKEPGIFAFGLIILADLFLFQKKISRLFQKENLKIYFKYLAIVLIYFTLRIIVFGSWGAVNIKRDHYGAFSFLERINAFFTLFADYVYKIFYPKSLLFYYYPFYKSASFLNFKFSLAFLVLTVFVFLAYLFYRLNKRNLTFLLAWFLIFLFPVIFFVDRIGENIFAERYAFASMAALSILAGCALNFIFRKKIAGKIFVVILLGCFVFWSWTIVFARNKSWKDSHTLYLETINQNPSVPLRYNYATDTLKAGDTAEAEKQFNLMLDYNPNWPLNYRTYNNLGEIYRQKGDTDKAIEYYQKALDLSGGKIADPYNNLAGVYIEQKQYLKSLIYLCKAVQINGQDENSQTNFNNIMSVVKSAKDRSYDYVYMDFMYGGIFKESAEQKIIYKKQICQGVSCFYFFQPDNLSQTDMLFTFLVLANGAPMNNDMITVKSAIIDHETGEIVVETDAKYKDKPKTFIFPNCDGIYYQVQLVLAGGVQ